MSNEHPILFSAPAVRALLDGSKMQTRRIIHPQPNLSPEGNLMGEWLRKPLGGLLLPKLRDITMHCPYGQPGDRLWVRETAHCDYRGETPPEGKGTIGVAYKAGGLGKMQSYALADRDLYPWFPNISHNANNHMRWAPAIHMPRWASRILLEIVSVRVERLNDISEADARAEGVTIEDRHMNGYCAGEFTPPSIRAFRELWESINGADSWTANPWLWVVEFKRVAS
jgi:hypothetical protein